MKNLLLLFLSLSLSGSLLALFLLAIKPLLKDRLSPTWQYYVWLIVVLRLLLPLTPQISLIGEITPYLQSALSPPAATAEKPPGQINESLREELTVTPAIQQEEDGLLLASREEDAPLAPSTHEKDMLPYLWMPWLAVALTRFVHQIVNYRRFVHLVKSEMEKVKDERILNIYQSELSQIKSRRPLPLYMNCQVRSPMLIGLLHPMIVLPTLIVSDDELRQMIRHELTHYKRLDILYKWSIQLVLCLHWFNPLVHLMSKEISRLCELSCDEIIIKHLDLDNRIIYGDALMATVTAQGKGQESTLSLTMCQDIDLIKERLDRIMKHQKKSRLAVSMTVLLTALLFCGFMFTGAYAAHNKDHTSDITPNNMSASAVNHLQKTEDFPANDHQIIKTLDGKDIRKISIDTEVCLLKLEPASGDTFEAVFSYPDILASNYEKHFTLKMEKENSHTIKISTEYDDQGFDPVEGFDYAENYPKETLTLKIPQKSYDAVKLNLTAMTAQPLAFDIDTKELEIKAVAVDLSLHTEKVFDRLALDLYAGNIDLQLKALSKTIDIDVAVGKVALTLPAEPPHVDLTINNKEMVVADDSAIYELPTSWKPSTTENTTTYIRGNGQNKIKVNNRQYGIFTVHVGGMTSQPGTTSSALPLAGTDQQNVEKEVPQIITDINATQYGRHNRRTVDGSNVFSTGRIDVMGDQGYACQAMVFACTGSDSYVSTFHQALTQLSSAYADHQNEIVGYLDLIRDNYRRNYTSDNFSVIKKVSITSAGGLPYDAYVVAICGSDEFMKPYDDFFDTLVETYRKDKN